MSKKQLKQAHVLRNYNEGRITRKSAAEALKLSERQITRLANGMKGEGELALVHKNTGRKPVHAITPEKAKQIEEIRKMDIFRGCNVSHFKELLEKYHDISISYTALYTLLKKAGIESPKKHKKTTQHRRRKRKGSAGELLQIDATMFDWFGDGVSWALHGAIDDATGQITGLYMTENECMHGYFEVIRYTSLTSGIPLSVYSDKHTIFRSPLTDRKAEKGEEANLTQFGRALDELGINIIYAHSPQAKGRIERLWETLQSRLPVEFRLHNITTIEEANEFLAITYIPTFNQQFSVPAENAPIFVPYVHMKNIDHILCVKETRKLDNAGIFSFHSRCFKILDEGYPIISAKSTVEVLVSTRQPLQVRYKDRIFHTVAYSRPEKASTSSRSKKVDAYTLRKQVEPYLRHGSEQWKKVWHYEDYDDSLAFLYELFFRPFAQ